MSFNRFWALCEKAQEHHLSALLSCHLPHETKISLRVGTVFSSSHWWLFAQKKFSMRFRAELEELKASNCPTDGFLGSLNMALKSVLWRCFVPKREKADFSLLMDWLPGYWEERRLTIKVGIDREGRRSGLVLMLEEPLHGWACHVCLFLVMGSLGSVACGSDSQFLETWKDGLKAIPVQNLP